MQDPLVSFMTPVRDRAEMMKRTVDSLLAQTYRNIEIILVESGSTDETWEVCKSYCNTYPNIEAYQIEELGQYPAYQKCVQEARGDIGAFVWSDDSISPTYLDEMVPLLHDNVGFVFCPAQIGNQTHYDLSPHITSITQSQYLEWALDPSIHGKVPLSPGCGIFHLRDMAIWDMDAPEDIREHPECGLDLALYVLTARKYPSVTFTPRTRAFFTAHPGSITVANSKACRRKYDIMREYLK